MRIGAVTLAFNDEGTIAGTIKCLEPFVNRHIVLISEAPYYGKKVEPDNTEEICLDLGVDVAKGTWVLDHFQRNLGNELLSDCDWLLTFDSDELITAKDAEKLIDFLSKTKADAVVTTPEVYWKTTDYRFTPKLSYQPPIAMRPKVRFPYIRNIDHSYVVNDDITMHHLSWCAPKDIKKKVTCYAHANEFTPDWYDKHYLGWKFPEPVIFPKETAKVEINPLPEELCQLLAL